MPPPEPQRPATILVVDDDLVVRTVMAAELAEDGHLLVEAADGVEALEACRASAPDLVVVDALMPRMDGFALCGALRRETATRFTPILMATGLDDEASIARAYVAGATDFIVKPTPWTILRQRIRYMLRSAEAFEEQRRSQATLLAAKEAAEAGARAKSEFLTAISHELRTPLNAVIGLSDVMRRQGMGGLSPEYLEFAELILENGRELLSMIDGVLDLASAESGDLALKPRPVDVRDLLAEVEAEMLALAARAEVAYVSEVEPGLPPIVADPDRLKRMLANLAGNAVKFNRPGGRARLTARRGPDGDLRLTIEDDGIGMSADTVERALAPFGQAEGGLTRRYGGAGVGLPLSHRLATLHGATLEIESREGEGTTVAVCFPASLFIPAAAA
jgi:signal transduction histidine kinase